MALVRGIVFWLSKQRRISFLFFFSFAFLPLSSFASNIVVIHDEEIKDFIKGISDPILTVAGIEPMSLTYYVILDSTPNAFVAGGQNIFVHTGLLTAASNADHIRGVLAHEIGHIAHGDLVAMNQQASKAAIPILLGLAAGLAAVAAGVPDSGAVMAMMLLGGQQVAMGQFFAFSREQESNADQAATKYLTALKHSTAGLADFMTILNKMEQNAGNASLSASLSWMRTHPLSQSRVDFLNNFTKNSPYGNNVATVSENQELRMIQAKIRAYNLQHAKNIIAHSFTDSPLEARYASANSHYFKGNYTAAIADSQYLIEKVPTNPYFYEVLASSAYDMDDYTLAVRGFSKAVDLRPQSAYYRFRLAQSYIGLNTPDSQEKALSALDVALHYDPKIAMAWRTKAMLLGRMGRDSEAKLALAEEYYVLGDRLSAKRQARTAQQGLPRNSMEWLRAQDILDSR